jgi:hypothetical protein
MKAIFNVEDHTHVKEGDIKEAMGLFSDITKALKAAVSKNMQPKNVKFFDDVFGFYGSEEFLDRLIHDPDLAGEKASLAVCLKMVSNPLEATSLHIPCATQHCDKPRAGVPGSDYCPMHHEARLREIVKEPKAKDFMANPEYRYYLPPFFLSLSLSHS